MGNTLNKPFLKYPGNKTLIVNEILTRLPKTKVLCDFFAGSGSIMLNSDYEKYILCDANSHIIRLYQTLQAYPDALLSLVDNIFSSFSNTPAHYYELRSTYNQLNDDTDSLYLNRASLFTMLNRSCYNGVVRFSKKTGFNVPFGRMASIKAPINQMKFFSEKAQNVDFHCLDFRASFNLVRDLTDFCIYLDPPYASLHKEQKGFTNYDGKEFDSLDQESLIEHVLDLRSRLSKSILISNHDTPYTRQLYADAHKILKLKVKRSISCKSTGRTKANELLAVF